MTNWGQKLPLSQLIDQEEEGVIIKSSFFRAKGRKLKNLK